MGSQEGPEVYQTESACPGIGGGQRGGLIIESLSPLLLGVDGHPDLPDPWPGARKNVGHVHLPLRGGHHQAALQDPLGVQLGFQQGGQDSQSSIQ